MDMTVNNLYLGMLMTWRSFTDWGRDDRGLDEAPSKLIWIGGGIVIAVAVVAFAINVFNETKEDVEDPVIPAVDGNR
jgi:hypothetical protein